MAYIRGYAVKLGVKLLLLGIIGGLITTYFVLNRSFPVGIGYIVGLSNVFVLSYLILSTVDEFIQNEYDLAEEVPQ